MEDSQSNAVTVVPVRCIIQNFFLAFYEYMLGFTHKVQKHLVYPSRILMIKRIKNLGYYSSVENAIVVYPDKESY